MYVQCYRAISIICKIYFSWKSAFIYKWKGIQNMTTNYEDEKFIYRARIDNLRAKRSAIEACLSLK